MAINCVDGTNLGQCTKDWAELGPKKNQMSEPNRMKRINVGLCTRAKNYLGKFKIMKM